MHRTLLICIASCIIRTSAVTLPHNRRAGCLELALGELEAALASYYHAGAFSTTRATYDEILTFRGTIKTRTPEKVTMTALREDPEITYNPTCLEMYLPDDEFHKVFGMAKDDFYRLRQWKQRELKKKAGLF